MKLSIDSSGRIVIPIEIRKYLKLNNVAECEFDANKNIFIIKSNEPSKLEQMINKRIVSKNVSENEIAFLKRLLKVVK